MRNECGEEPQGRNVEEMMDDGLGLPNPDTIYWAAGGVRSPGGQVTWEMPPSRMPLILA